MKKRKIYCSKTKSHHLAFYCYFSHAFFLSQNYTLFCFIRQGKKLYWILCTCMHIFSFPCYYWR